MPARTVKLKDALHDRAVLRRAVPARLENLQTAFSQLEKLTVYNPIENDRTYIITSARKMLASLEETYNNVATTQLDMELFNE